MQKATKTWRLLILTTSYSFVFFLLAYAFMLWWSSSSHPFYQSFWATDFPPASRMTMAEYFAATKSLEGKRITEVKDMLSFDHLPDTYEVTTSKGHQLFVIPVKPFLGKSKYLYLEVKDSKVIDQTLSGDSWSPYVLPF